MFNIRLTYTCFLLKTVKKIKNKIKTGSSLEFNGCNKIVDDVQIKIVENSNNTLNSCLNKRLNLLDLDKKKYVEIKKCLDEVVDVSIVKTIEVFAHNKRCKKSCLKCKRFYNIEFGYFKTVCEENKILKYHLCYGPFKNTPEENGVVKGKGIVSILITTILLLTIMASVLFCYRKFIRNNNPCMVSKNIKYTN